MKRKALILWIACALISITGCAKQAQKGAEANNEVATNVSETTTNNNESAATDDKNSSAIVKTIPEGLPTDSILPTIIKDYKGQVVLIDFWATWCGPCMMAMKQIDPIKEKYLSEGKKVAFVYITGETSPLDKWQATIPTIKGYHYRLTNNEFNGLLRLLGIRGIPTYYIADKNGRHFYDNIQTGGYPGDDVIQAQLDDALNKK